MEAHLPLKLLILFDPLDSGRYILRSCNDLLLCASCRAHELNRIYYVYNPTTVQFAILPPIRR